MAGAAERRWEPQAEPDAAGRLKHVYVLGYADVHRRLIERLPAREGLRVHELLPLDALRGVTELPVAALVREAEERLRCGPPADGIVAFIDFPASEIMGLLNDRLGLRGPSLTSQLACNHKLWSRELQAEVAPEAVPEFAAFDPFDARAFERLAVRPPLWIKPLNAYCSTLGFRVRKREDFEAGAAAMRESLAKFADPLAYFMEHADVPEHIRRLGSRVALAEAMIGGRQCTLEGYVYEGEPVVYGIVDSFRDPNRSSFSRYQYPSRLPRPVTARMVDIAKRVMRRTGFDNATFNIELFYQQRTDRIWLVEINPRFSQSHFELFEKVDGESNQRIAIELALGRRPDPPKGAGPYRVAAKFFVRVYRRGRLTRVPSAAELERLAERYPGLTVQLKVAEGDALAELEDQDSYSYELAYVWLGARTERELLQRWREVRRSLHFEIEGEPVT